MFSVCAFVSHELDKTLTFWPPPPPPPPAHTDLFTVSPSPENSLEKWEKAIKLTSRRKNFISCAFISIIGGRQMAGLRVSFIRNFSPMNEGQLI